MRKLLVIGGGKSGLSALELGHFMDHQCFLYDDYPEKIEDNTRLFLNAYGVELLSSEQVKKVDFDTVVVSPGVPQTNKIVKFFLEKNSDVISEIEFGFRYLKGNVIGITGSNGKTTTTAMVGHIMHGEEETAVCGNYGYPFCKALIEQKFEGWYVVELSSFQLELIKDFKPKIACILNLSPDHLDRYNSLEDYYFAKFNIFKNMNKNTVFFANADDDGLLNYRDKLPSFTRWIGEKTLPIGVDEKGIYYERNLILRSEQVRFKGLHNLYNAAFAISMAHEAGIGLRHCVEKIRSFNPIEHRLEFVDIIRGVYFYNDSKATNFDSVKKALSSFKNIRWIAGGIYKGGDFEDFYIYRENIKKGYFIGDSAPIFMGKMKGIIDCEISINIENAIKHAFNEANPGDVILLSPACSSFDQFKNYEERGKVFKNLVKRLKDEL
ncbi:UDP-N-acetylmuramoyl-L-alanine--D-glutamate ligase [Thermotomaculum hydrothermale]|nr:UDP-N-acetylmuramoyl-L-alanine--D-glutamate ligase [Thermotomaculum hydrothermale]